MDVISSLSPVFYVDSVQEDVFLALEGYRKAPSKKDAVVAKAMVGALVDWYRYGRMEARVNSYKARRIGESVIMKVAANRRGGLSKCRGRYVRIIAMSRDGFATFLRFSPLELTKAQEEALIPFKN
jgi:hypothetical protein